MIRVCVACNQIFEIDDAQLANLEQLRREHGGKWTLPKRCLPCRASRRRERELVTHDTPIQLRPCASCGAEFSPFTSEGERDYFAQRGWVVPRRCPACRLYDAPPENNRLAELDEADARLRGRDRMTRMGDEQ